MSTLFDDPDKPRTDRKGTHKTLDSRLTAAILLAVWFVGAMIYHFVHNTEAYRGSGVMFIGIPAVLSVLLALAPARENASVTAGIMRGIALFLLIVSPLLGEGYLCILIASPIFFAVGGIIGLIVDKVRASKAAKLSCATLIVLPFLLEGVAPQFTHTRIQTVTVTRTVDAPFDAVTAAISQPPHPEAALPRFLRIGFPLPLASFGGGLRLGDTRTVHFSGAEGDPEGDLVLRVDESRTGFVHLTAVSDSSKITQWLRWLSSDIAWHPLDATHTTVSCTLTFQRQLDPLWYFAPWEHLAVHEAAKYLITTNATPRG